MEMPKKVFSAQDALTMGQRLNIAWDTFDAAQLAAGMNVELEHGRHDPQTDVTGDDPLTTAKIALAHLKEFPDYYVRLGKMEEEAEAYWGDRE